MATRMTKEEWDRRFGGATRTSCNRVPGKGGTRNSDQVTIPAAETPDGADITFSDEVQDRIGGCLIESFKVVGLTDYKDAGRLLLTLRVGGETFGGVFEEPLNNAIGSIMDPQVNIPVGQVLPLGAELSAYVEVQNPEDGFDVDQVFYVQVNAKA